MRLTNLYEVIGLSGRIINFVFPLAFTWVIGLETYGEWILCTSLGLLIANLTDCRLLIWGAKIDRSELLFIEIIFSIIGLSICVLVLIFLSRDFAVVLGSYFFAVFGRILGWIAFFSRSRYLLRISQGFLPGVAGIIGLSYIFLFESITNLALLRFGLPLIIFVPLCLKYFPAVEFSVSHCRKSISNFNRVLILKLGKQIVGNVLINQVDKILVGIFFSNASLGAYALFTSAHAGINMLHSYWINILIADDKKYQFYFISGTNLLLSICLGVFQSDLHDFVSQFFKKWESISAFCIDRCANIASKDGSSILSL